MAADSASTRPYRTAAAYYHARPPYSAQLHSALVAKLGWDGTGRLLDVGCGPGVLALELAPAFGEVIGLDPEPAMLAEAQRRHGADSIQWIEGRAEEMPGLGLGHFDAVTFGQSLQWMDRPSVIEIVFSMLRPSGAMLVINHIPPDLSRESAQEATPFIPHGLVDEVLAQYGAAKPPRPAAWERHEVVIGRSPFGGCDVLVLPGRRDLVRTPEWIVENQLSTSYAAPERFGERLADFQDDLLRRLRHVAGPKGVFLELPGDTEVLIARKLESADPK
ncbi:MAG TPA: class I SAM-dependent methyltransferase [Candidatus Micrarchaeaceae archaeon]|nr:class I SAM-dependent methyltransferase [Candidatus Micrarchaeaceae archaeon]